MVKSTQIKFWIINAIKKKLTWIQIGPNFITSLPTFQVRQAEGEQKGFATYSDALKPQTLSKLKTDVFLVEMAFRGRLALSMISAPMPHT